MSTEIDIRVFGDKELQRKLKALPLILQKKILRSAMRAGGKIVLDSAKQRVPVDTGALQASLKLRAMKRSKNVLGVQILTGKGFFVGKQFYGAFLELGTHKLPARPYLRPALEENRTSVLGLMQQEIASRIAAEARNA